MKSSKEMNNDSQIYMSGTEENISSLLVQEKEKQSLKAQSPELQQDVSPYKIFFKQSSESPPLKHELGPSKTLELP